MRLPAVAPANMPVYEAVPGRPPEAARLSSNLSLGEAELLLLLSCNSCGGGGGLICSASLEVAEAVVVLLLMRGRCALFKIFKV